MNSHMSTVRRITSYKNNGREYCLTKQKRALSVSSKRKRALLCYGHFFLLGVLRFNILVQ